MREELRSAKVELQPYEDVLPEVMRLREEGKRLMLDTSQVTPTPPSPPPTLPLPPPPPPPAHVYGAERFSDDCYEMVKFRPPRRLIWAYKYFLPT